MKIIKTSSIKKESNRWYNKPSTKTTGKKHETFIERNGEEIEVVMQYDFFPGEQQSQDSQGWPPEVDLYQVTDQSGNPVETSPEEDERFKTDIMEYLESYHSDPPDDRGF